MEQDLRPADIDVIPAATLNKWQATLTRLNNGQPHLAGLMAFTEASPSAKLILKM